MLPRDMSNSRNKSMDLLKLLPMNLRSGNQMRRMLRIPLRIPLSFLALMYPVKISTFSAALSENLTTNDCFRLSKMKRRLSAMFERLRTSTSAACVGALGSLFMIETDWARLGWTESFNPVG